MLKLINKILKGLNKNAIWASVLTFISAVSISAIFGLSITFIVNKLKNGNLGIMDYINYYFKISIILFPIIFILSFFTSNGKLEDSVWETIPGSETVLVPNNKDVKLSIVELKNDKIVVQFGDSGTDEKEYYLDPDSKVEKTETVEEPSVTSAIVLEKKSVKYYRGKGYYTPNKPREFLKIDGKMKLKDSEKVLNSVENGGEIE